MHAVSDAILTVLCHGQATYRTGYVGRGTLGFFSQLNAIADGVLVRLYLGERPHSANELYGGTRLLGYGNVTIGEYFAPYSCDGVASVADVVPHVQTLLAARRHVVVSHVLHTLYQSRRSRDRGNDSSCTCSGVQSKHRSKKAVQSQRTIGLNKVDPTVAKRIHRIEISRG